MDKHGTTTGYNASITEITVATSMATCLTFGVFKVTTIAKIVLYYFIYMCIFILFHIHVYFKFKYL